MPNYYDLPFNDILDWSQFSVVLKETNIYLLKDILRSISEKHFISLNRNIVKSKSISSGIHLQSDKMRFIWLCMKSGCAAI
ncbi:hypothetical protein JHK82_041498 [Glycine max]|nr:hypothetical protein JHK85_042164 [Glycine max]KAG5104528.1 hypothetical protein JHK82_041498 [Glycine max]KAG5115654.1 hypothetical protein JHK84_041767 [Glycine max]